jgi:hypothetical protein
VDDAVHRPGCAAPVKIDHIGVVLNDEHSLIADRRQSYLEKESLPSLVKGY